VVDEAVVHGGGDGVVAEDLAPAAEGLVRGDDQGGSFVAGRDELEEQVRGFGLERDVADLVDLCGYPHRSTYAETATMPRQSRCGSGSDVLSGLLSHDGSAGLGIVAG
jgi:hypothetical protein